MYSASAQSYSMLPFPLSTSTKIGTKSIQIHERFFARPSANRRTEALQPERVKCCRSTKKSAPIQIPRAEMNANKYDFQNTSPPSTSTVASRAPLLSRTLIPKNTIPTTARTGPAFFARPLKRMLSFFTSATFTYCSLHWMHPRVEEYLNLQHL